MTASVDRSRLRVLMLVENLPVPFDRRVWMESVTLQEAGHRVTVICPAGRYGAGRQVVNGIVVYRYPLPSLAGLLGHLFEYAVALLLTGILAWVVFFREGFDVIHAANPPDLFYLVARTFRPFGRRFIFDHHDLMPETCLTRWGGWKLRIVLPLVRHTERASFRTADVVISTNESYRSIALERGAVPRARTFVVRSAPRRDRFQPVAPDPALRAGFNHLVAYLGVMGPNDGLDLLVSAIHHIVRDVGRTDIRFVLIGDGDERARISRAVAARQLDYWVTFTGRISDNEAIVRMCTADVCVAPDPKDPLNDASSMNKIVEYMALARPIVSFDLKETMKTAGAASLYAPSNNVVAFGDLIMQLLDSPTQRERMGSDGRRRFLDELCWECQQTHLLRAYRCIGREPVVEYA